MTEEEKLILLIEKISGKRVALNENLNEIGVLDSISRVDLALEIEKEFQIKIPFQLIDSNNFSSVKSILKLIHSV